MSNNNLEYQREYQRKHYAANAERYKARANARRLELADWFHSYKATLSCVCCGEGHPATLDFHHRNPDEKEILISMAMRAGWSKKRILNEIAKCDVLCANCHRKLHYEE